MTTSNPEICFVNGLKLLPETDRLTEYQAMITSDAFLSLDDHHRSQAFVSGLSTLPEQNRLEEYKAMITSDHFVFLSDMYRRDSLECGLTTLPESDQVIALKEDEKVTLVCSEETTDFCTELTLQFDTVSESINLLGWNKESLLNDQDTPHLRAQIATIFEVAHDGTDMSAGLKKALNDLRNGQKLPADSDWSIAPNNIIKIGNWASSHP